MNPSSSGWINKYDSLISDKEILFKDYKTMYSELRSLGFIYGLTVNTPEALIFENQYSQDESVKINLFTALYHVYFFNRSDSDFKSFVNTALTFYKDLDVSDLSLWDKLFTAKDNASVLERLLHDRIQINDNLLTRNFNKSITNALVYVDVLTFKAHLEKEIDVKVYAAKLENIIINITYDALNFKNKKNDEEKEIIKSIKESISYVKKNRNDFNLLYRNALETNFTISEKHYFLDMACLAVWDTIFTDDKEYNFVKSIGVDMNIASDTIEEALFAIATFHKNYKKELQLFKSSNPISNFYQNSSQLVIKLIRRNSKRILKELAQSKDLMLLLSQSATRDLTKEEQEKVQLQLIDIFKTIPSLAIFILPGGAILLPIVAKIIPNILPSAFDDNRVEDKKDDSSTPTKP